MGSALQTYKRNEKLAVWSKRVQECRSSGLTVAEWCEQNGINKYTYYDWQKKVFNAAESVYNSSEVEFAELNYSRKEHAVATINKNGIVVEIHSTDALIEVLQKC